MLFVKPKSFILLVFILIAVGMTDSGQVFAGISLDDTIPEETKLKEWPYEIVIAVVKDVYKNQANTNEDPPRLIISIEEILQGKAMSGYVNTIWPPYGFYDDVGDFRKLHNAWLKERLPPPGIGTKWILRGRFDEKQDIFIINTRYEYTEELLKWVKSALKNK